MEDNIVKKNRMLQMISISSTKVKMSRYLTQFQKGFLTDFLFWRDWNVLGKYQSVFGVLYASEFTTSELKLTDANHNTTQSLSGQRP